MNHLIEQQSQLDALQPLFEQLKDSGQTVSVDTEFLREKTYNAKLCLVQLGIGEDQYCIDVLAIDDLSLLAGLLAEESVTKLLHAARQDMEVLWQTFALLPRPVFDTQLAAAFCGMDLQIGHTALVQEKLGVELSKSQARTDWTKRPLSGAQLKYAAEDVTYLASLHQILADELQASGKQSWFMEEIEDLYDVSKYEIDPNDAYQRLNGGNLKLEQQYTLRDLAAWRESRAQQRNIPRTWVMRDDKLYDLAIKRPQSIDEIIDLGVFGRKSADRLAPTALEIISSVEVGDQPLWRRVDPLDKQQKSEVSALMNRVKQIAQDQQIAQGLLGTRKDMESLFRHRQSNKLLQGWRADIVGKPLMEMLQKGG